MWQAHWIQCIVEISFVKALRNIRALVTYVEKCVVIVRFHTIKNILIETFLG